MDYSALPGYELIREGLRDLEQGRLTTSGLLAAIGAERLRRIGLDVPDAKIADPEHELYMLLARDDPDSAHSRYNAMVRQLVSFERAAECAA
ncbi:MAG TPA: hypothetical protein VGS96_05245 [Thermoanaerobaculia bacterium]|jgi:hypothetical protein|nr:hypothetical protein [Thermoanaerobaculia bacterium]